MVAHPDDDLLFLSPDLLDSLRSGGDVCTVYLTAGDAGRAEAYWRSRMLGVRAAYANLFGSVDVWSESTWGAATSTSAATSGDRASEDRASGPVGATVLALQAAPRISLVFLKLPDGGAGSGFARYGHGSLHRLWTGRQGSLTCVDGSASYTRDSLTVALAALIRSFGPDIVRTQDFLGAVGDGDHTDHHITGYLVRRAWEQVVAPRPELVAYQDYRSANRPANVVGAALEAKRASFGAYCGHDVMVCQPGTAVPKAVFEAWIRRQYVLARLH